MRVVGDDCSDPHVGSMSRSSARALCGLTHDHASTRHGHHQLTRLLKSPLRCASTRPAAQHRRSIDRGERFNQVGVCTTAQTENGRPGTMRPQVVGRCSRDTHASHHRRRARQCDGCPVRRSRTGAWVRASSISRLDERAVARRASRGAPLIRRPQVPKRCTEARYERRA